MSTSANPADRERRIKSELTAEDVALDNAISAAAARSRAARDCSGVILR